MVLDVENVLAGLTLEEKASLTSGASMWQTEAVPRADVPAVVLSDGPHGLRRTTDDTELTDLGGSVPATCFPTAAALGSSWDVGLLRRVGAALGAEAAALGVAVVLGPGVNIKRSPLCGRNFEYLSEDPLVSGVLGAALVEGLQSRGVGASVKHFAANNQETDRMRVSADVDERTLREIYLPAFERVVTQARPWTVMCSYNRVNGTHAAEDRWLLTRVLREEWGFDGLVVSDWGAVRGRVPALLAGLDLQMPSAGPRPDAEVVAAVRSGALDEAVLDEAARRVLTLVARAQGVEPAPVDLDAHHELAREAAAAGCVLLRNELVDGPPLLPLTGTDGLLVVGETARTPRYQGAGSSQVNPTRLDDALSAFRAVDPDVAFEPGYRLDHERDDTLLPAALEAAAAATTVVLFLGLPAADESEGYDRRHLDLPPEQVRLLRALTEVNPRVVVVLANGSVVRVSDWHATVPALLEAWLGGQAGGTAVVDVLLGRREPGGRLAETVPHRLEDTPAFGNFPGEAGHVRYGEGVLVGYRWYDTRDVDVAYPFGHGLTYTTFGYDDLRAEVTGTGADAGLRVCVRVTNTGARAGREVVQVYLRDPEAAVLRPLRELRAFTTVDLAVDESRDVTFDLDARALSYWHPGLRRWVVEGGEVVVEVGRSSRDVRVEASVEVVGEDLWEPLTTESTLREWLAHPVGAQVLGQAMAELDLPELDVTTAAMVEQMPLRVVADLGISGFTPEALDALVAAAGRR